MVEIEIKGRMSMVVIDSKRFGIMNVECSLMILTVTGVYWICNSELTVIRF
jgi:hypothetical protein